MPTNSRSTHRRTIAITVALWCAALVGAGLYLAAADEPAALPTAITQPLPTSLPTGPAPAAAASDLPAAPPATEPIDEPGADDVEPDQPDPEPQPDPMPQVPLGADDFAPTPPPPPPTCGGECVAPVDLHPWEQPAGNPAADLPLAGNDTAGCSVDCITRAQAFVGADTTDVEIEVSTHTAAFIKVSVSTSEPAITPSGHPYFPGVVPALHTTGDLDLDFTGTLTGLEEETHYWVIVTATDAQVRSSDVVGEIVTPRVDDDIEVIFAAIDITYDGDKGRNKGELDFRWGIGLQEVGGNGEYQRGDGSRIDLDGQINSYGRFDLGDGALGKLWVTGLEHDPGTLEFCSATDEPTGYGTDNACGYAWNSTLPVEFTIADVAAMSDCDAFDLGPEFEGYRCTRVATTESHSGIPEFSVVVAFRVF